MIIKKFVFLLLIVIVLLTAIAGSSCGGNGGDVDNTEFSFFDSVGTFRYKIVYPENESGLRYTINEKDEGTTEIWSGD